MAKNVRHDEENKLNNTQIILTSLTSGAIAGALAKTTIAPLDRTKINFQIGNKSYSTKKAFKFLVKTLRTEGFLALWRGNSATMARIVPHAAIQFTAFEQWKKVLRLNQMKGESSVKLFLAGSLAGVTSQSITYPLDLARARMAVTPKQEYATLRDVFCKIYRSEGMTRFYKGYVPTIIGVVPYAGVSFFTYDSLKRLYKEHFDDDRLHPVASLLFGAVAGMLGQSSSYPLDIVRRRMQTDTTGKYPSIFSTLEYVYRTEGVTRGLYKGLSMNWIKGPIAVGISFATYDIINNFLRTILTKCRGQVICIE